MSLKIVTTSGHTTVNLDAFRGEKAINKTLFSKKFKGRVGDLDGTFAKIKAAADAKTAKEKADAAAKAKAEKAEKSDK